MIDVGWLEEWISKKYVRSNRDNKNFKKHKINEREQKFGGKDG